MCEIFQLLIEYIPIFWLQLYMQIEVVKPGLVGSFYQFAKRYCDAHMETLCGGRVQKWITQ